MKAQRAARTLDFLAKLRKKTAEMTKEQCEKLVMDPTYLTNSQTALKLLSQVKLHAIPTKETYNRILSVLSREGRHASVVSILREMDMTHRADAMSYEIGLTSCGRHGEVARARLLLYTMRRKGLPRSATAYSGAIQACAPSGNIQRAKAFWKDMEAEQILPNRDTFASMLDVYHRSRRTDVYNVMNDLFESAINTYDVSPTRVMGLAMLNALPTEEIVDWVSSMQSRGLKIMLDGEMYRVAMARLDRTGDIDGVEQILDKYLHARPTIRPRDVVPFLGNLRLSPPSIRRIVNQLWKFFVDSSPDARLFNTLLNLLALSNLHDDFHTMVRTMIDKNLADPHTYRIALTYTGDRTAQDEYLAALEAAEFPEHASSMLTFNGALHYCIDANRMDIAEAFFEYMPVLPDAHSYGILIKGYANQPPSSKNKARALELFRDMVKEGLRPSTAGLVCVIKTLRQSPDEVLPFVRQLVRHPKIRVSIDVFHSAMEVFRTRGMWRQAMELESIMEGAGVRPTKETHTMMLLACANGGEFNAAMAFLHEHYGQGMQPTIDVFNAAIEVCAKTKRVDEALALFAGISENGLTPTDKTYIRLINVLVYSRELDLAEAILLQMIEQGIAVTLPVYHRLLRGCCIMGTLEKSYEILEKLKDSMVQPNVLTYSHVLQTMLQSKRHGLEDMHALLDDLRSHGLEPTVEVYTMMMQKCMMTSHFHDAMYIFDSMVENDIYPDEICFDVYLDAWTRHMRRLLNPSQTPTEDIPEIPDIQVLVQHFEDTRWSSNTETPDAFVAVLRLLQMYGEVTKRNMTDVAHKLLLRMDDSAPSQTAKAYGIVMQMFNDDGQYEQVEKMFQSMPTRQLKPNASCYVEYMVAMEAADRWSDSTNAFVELQSRFSPISSDLLRRSYIGRHYLRTNTLLHQ